MALSSTSTRRSSTAAFATVDLGNLEAAQDAWARRYDASMHPPQPPILTSPRSLQACLECGIDPEVDLDKRSLRQHLYRVVARPSHGGPGVGASKELQHEALHAFQLATVGLGTLHEKVAAYLSFQEQESRRQPLLQQAIRVWERLSSTNRRGVGSSGSGSADDARRSSAGMERYRNDLESNHQTTSAVYDPGRAAARPADRAVLGSTAPAPRGPGPTARAAAMTGRSDPPPPRSGRGKDAPMSEAKAKRPAPTEAVAEESTHTAAGPRGHFSTAPPPFSGGPGGLAPPSLAGKQPRDAATRRELRPADTTSVVSFSAVDPSSAIGGDLSGFSWGSQVEWVANASLTPAESEKGRPPSRWDQLSDATSTTLAAAAAGGCRARTPPSNDRAAHKGGTDLRLCGAAPSSDFSPLPIDPNAPRMAGHRVAPRVGGRGGFGEKKAREQDVVAAPASLMPLDSVPCYVYCANPAAL